MAEGTEVGTAYVSIVPSAAGFGAKLQAEITGEAGLVGQKAGQALGAGITSSTTGVAKSVAGVFAAIGTAKFLHGALDEAQQAVKVGNLTNAVLKSTGGAAGVTAAQVEKLATSLSKVAGVDDEVIQGAENVLLTFRDVRNQVGAGNDIFNQATKAALDMSAALGGDLQGNVIQLGKALNDPIQGMTALRRVGVSFTEEQVAQIKALQQTGDLLGAQKIILRELNQEFGGAAAANATALDRLHVSVKNLEESLGTALLPEINAMSGGLSSALDIFTALPGPIQAVIAGLGGLGAASIALGLLAPKIAAARLELEGMGRAGTLASNALGVLGKVGLGLAVAATTAEGLNFLGNAITHLAAGPVAPINALTKSLVELGTNGQVTGELAKQLGGNLGQLSDKASDVAGSSNPLAKLGGALAGVLNPSIRDSKRDIDQLDKALAGLVSSGHADVAKAALERMSAAIAAGPGGQGLADKFVRGLNDYKEALNGVAVQAVLTGPAVEQVGDAAITGGDQAAEAAKQWDDLRGKIEDLVTGGWSTKLASDITSALNPLELFVAGSGKNLDDLRTQVQSASADLTKAKEDLAKLEKPGAGPLDDTLSFGAKVTKTTAGQLEEARVAVTKAAGALAAAQKNLADSAKSPLRSLEDNLNANLKTISDWLANLQKVASKVGGPAGDDLAKHLGALGPQAAGAVAEATKLSKGELDKLEGLFVRADKQIGDAASGAFELSVDQAAKPGETLAQIIADRYQKSLIPKFTAATLKALNEATTAILAAEATALQTQTAAETAALHAKNEANAQASGSSSLGPVAPAPAGPPAPPVPPPLINVPGFTMPAPTPAPVPSKSVVVNVDGPVPDPTLLGRAIAWEL